MPILEYKTEMPMPSLKENVERWLVHENFHFKYTTTDEDNFRISIKHIAGFGNKLEIFEPKNQPNVIVLGSKCMLRNFQNARFMEMSDREKQIFDNKIANFAKSIHAVYRSSMEDGKKVTAVHIILDKQDKLNQKDFINAIVQVGEMSDKMSKYLTYI